MNDAESQREAELADFLAEARTNFRCGRIPDLSTWQSRYPDQIGELLGLLKTVQDLDTLLNEPPVSATVDYVAGKGAPVPGPLPEQIGRYRILKWLGSGGMGTVYRAHDPHLDREVALKVPRLDPLWDDRALAVQRFLREARAAAGVRHPHVCPIYDAGEQAGVPYVVMAFIQGPNLSGLLRPEGLEPRLASKLVSKVALGLEAVHAQGIIHRDLKPGNILLDAAGEPLVTDFGLACLRQEQKPLTVYGVLLGTPGYMAPEQVSPQAGPLGPWTDIYSLGVVLYQLLTGRTPFVESGFTLLYQIGHEKPPPPSQFRAGLDPALEAIVLKALAQRPEDRFASAGQFSEALEGWLRGESPIVNRDLPTVADAAKTAPMTVRTDLPGGGAVTVTVEGGSKMPSQLELTVEQQQATARKRRHKLHIKITVAVSLLLPLTGLLALLPWILSQDDEPRGMVSPGDEYSKVAHRLRLAAQSKEREAKEAIAKSQLLMSQQIVQTLIDKGKFAEAEAFLKRALAISQSLLGENHPDTVSRYQQLARTLSAQGKSAEAESLLEKVLAAKEKLVAKFPANPQYREELAKTYFLLGAMRLGTDQMQQAEEAYRNAIKTQNQLIAEFPSRPEYRLQLASAYNNLGRLLALRGEMAQAVASFKEAVNLGTQPLGKVKERKPADAKRIGELVQQLGSLKFAVRESACRELEIIGIPALEALRQAAKSQDLEIRKRAGDIIRLLEEKINTAHDPERESRRELAISYNNLGAVYQVLGRLADAQSYRQRAVKLWSDLGVKEIFSIKVLHADARTVAFSPDGTLLASGSQDQDVILWDLGSGQKKLSLKKPSSSITRLAFSPDGRNLVTASLDGKVRLWDATTGVELRSLPGHTQPVISVAFSPDGKFVAGGGRDKEVNVWDTHSGRQVLSRPGNGGTLAELVYGSDGKCLAGGSEEGVTGLWDVASGRAILSFKEETGPVKSMAFNSRRNLLASVSKEGVKFWNTATRKEVQLLGSYQNQVSQVAFSTDGKLLATVSRDNLVKVWNAQTGQEIITLPVSKIAHVVFSPEGRHLACIAQDGSVHVWNIAPAQPKP
jgi:WD40 repeat protein/serine/threonine protein kinase